MIVTILLSFLAGLFLGNGIPHFIKGITKESYPMVFDNSPIPNLIAGWFSLLIGIAMVYQAHLEKFSIQGFTALTVGILLIGLFHAGPGAFGKKS